MYYQDICTMLCYVKVKDVEDEVSLRLVCWMLDRAVWVPAFSRGVVRCSLTRHSSFNSASLNPTGYRLVLVNCCGELDKNVE